MISVPHEIQALRQSNHLNIESCNHNRHRVVIQEANGTKSAYYFSTPIYNADTGKLIRLRFDFDGNSAILQGSNSTIRIDKEIHMNNKKGYCKLVMESLPTSISEQKIWFGEDCLFPTTNGIAYIARIKNKSSVAFDVLTDLLPQSIRSNNRYFSLMSERFIPFLTVSCIGSGKSDLLHISSAATLKYTKKSDQKYTLSIYPEDASAKWLMFEVNLHEPKLIQDTTVESLFPRANNVFGSSAFIGESTAYGEQWLYTKLDFPKISDLIEKRLHKCLLHIPTLNDSTTKLRSYGVASRFCSFGSTWDNKIPATRAIALSSIVKGYQTLDITNILRDNHDGRLMRSDGMIIRPELKNSHFSAIATADSYYHPQILEINYNDT